VLSLRSRSSCKAMANRQVVTCLILRVYFSFIEVSFAIIEFVGGQI